MGSVTIKDYLTKNYGPFYFSTRSLSDIWIKGGLEVKAKPRDIITFRSTQLALLGHL